MVRTIDKSNAAEWLLRLVVDPARASEFVGDQLETHRMAGNLQFWISIARVFFAFSWRTIAGIVTSPIASILLTFGLFIFVHPQFGGSLGLSVSSVIHIQLYLTGFSLLLWAATVFSVVRFGRRSNLAWTGLMASVLCTASLDFFGQEMPSIVLALLWTGFFVFHMSKSSRRRTLGIFCCAVFAAWLTGFVLSVASHDPNSIFGKWEGIAVLFLAPVVESSAILFLSGRFPVSEGQSVAVGTD